MTMELFLSARLDEDENAIKNREWNLPIHFPGCWYYDNNLDINAHCDCDEDGSASKKALAEIKAKRSAAECLTGRDRDLIIAILSVPYADHPDFPGTSQALQAL
jgi:hypothetical protein